METLQPHIKKVVARYGCNEADAADLCQELNLKLWLRPSKLLNAAVMDAYLTQAIRNLWLDHLRRQSRIAERLPTVALDDAQLLIGQSAPEAEQVEEAECRLLEDIWLELDAREQRVVTEWQAQPQIKPVARLLGLDPKQVRRALSHAALLLRLARE